MKRRQEEKQKKAEERIEVNLKVKLKVTLAMRRSYHSEEGKICRKAAQT